MNRPTHWAEDPYWVEAYEKFIRLRDQEGKTSFTLDLAAVEEGLFNSETAYKLMDAMVSVKEKEAMDGFRGAPRVLLALLVRLEELSQRKSKKAKKE